MKLKPIATISDSKIPLFLSMKSIKELKIKFRNDKVIATKQDALTHFFFGDFIAMALSNNMV